MTVTIARALSLSVSVTPEEKVSFSVIFVMASHLLFMTTARFADWASLDRVMLMEDSQPLFTFLHVIGGCTRRGH